MKKKTLLIVVNVDWFFKSHRLLIAQFAKQNGYNVHLAMNFTNYQDYFKSLGFKTHELKMVRNKINLLSLLSDFYELLCLFNKIKPDVIHLVTLKPVLVGGIASKLVGINSALIAISGLGWFSDSKRSSFSVKHHIASLMYKLAVNRDRICVVVQNKSDEEVIRDTTNLNKRSFLMLYGSGVDLKLYSRIEEQNSHKNVLLISRMLKDKGVFEFVEASRILKTKLKDVEFILVGSPDIYNPNSISSTQLKSWHDSGVIKWLGHRDDIHTLIANSNIVVLPSYYGEGMPKVLLEAAASGRAVITTDWPGCNEAVVDDVTGLLVPIKNPILLAVSIFNLINDDKKRKKIGINARKRAEKLFSVEKVAEIHLAAYEKLVPNDQYI
ncbi:glycosyltransferase family 4 protein [Opitutales bacterium]|nr:glycosyltransferase family 4 protein [Opitutales bacterium]